MKLPVNEIICGDSLQVMRDWPDQSVNCCVTSPPYWGLRDYGTASWEGGDAECDHLIPLSSSPLNAGFNERCGNSPGAKKQEQEAKARQFVGTCGKCGAKRIDQQLGLEPTPEEYVAKMVEVFREVRRVLRDDGTCWLNLGDSYNTGTNAKRQESQCDAVGRWQREGTVGGTGRNKVAGLKPKDLCGIPWRVALALQADGWYLRQDIIWHKPNPMPESCKDRCTKSHEYIFLMAKSKKYYYDAEAVKENKGIPTRRQKSFRGGCYTNNTAFNNSHDYSGHEPYSDGDTSLGGRNRRSVWTVPTAPYSEAHFATFPPALITPCILAGCPKEVCVKCGEPRSRIVKSEQIKRERKTDVTRPCDDRSPSANNVAGVSTQTTGWTDCGCGAGFRPGIVCDVFMGSGTVAEVAAKNQRDYVGCELNPEYMTLNGERAAAAETGIPVKEARAGQKGLFE